MNTMQEAINKANIDMEDLKKNESTMFNMFPFVVKWRSVLPNKAAYMNRTYRFKQSCRSQLVWEWVKQQDKDIIKFLRKNRHRIYTFPTNKCYKLLETWIGYNARCQQFVIRVNPFAQSVQTIPGQNNYAGKLGWAMSKIMDVEETESHSFVERLNWISPDEIADIIKLTFSTGVIPVEQFDPILDINTTVAGSLITIESDDMNVVREQLSELERTSNILSDNKLHRKVVDHYSSFNNIKPKVMNDRDWVNWVYCDVRDQQKTPFFVVL